MERLGSSEGPRPIELPKATPSRLQVQLFEFLETEQYDSAIQLIEKNPVLLQAKNREGLNPLHIAARVGSLQAVNYLLGKAEVNPAEISQDNQKATPLLLACKYGNWAVVEKLLEKGAQLNEKDREGNGPLHYACLGGKAGIARKLVEKNPQLVHEKNHFEEVPFYHACQHGGLELYRFFLEHGFHANISFWDGSYPIHLACAGGKNEVIKEILKTNPDHVKKCNGKNGRSPLHYALPHLETMKFLLQKNTPILVYDEAGCAPIHYLVEPEPGNWEKIRLLLEKEPALLRVSTDERMNLLHLACEKSNTDIIPYLLANQINIYQYDAQGLLPVDYAWKNGRIDIVQKIEKFAPPFRQKYGEEKRVFLESIYQFRDKALIDFAIRHGPDFTVKDAESNTLLHHLIRVGTKEYVREILRENPSLQTAANLSGETPLHIACKANRREFFDLFPDAFWKKDSNGLLPVEYLEKRHEILENMALQMQSLVQESAALKPEEKEAWLDTLALPRKDFANLLVIQKLLISLSEKIEIPLKEIRAGLPSLKEIDAVQMQLDFFTKVREIFSLMYKYCKFNDKDVAEREEYLVSGVDEKIIESYKKLLESDNKLLEKGTDFFQHLNGVISALGIKRQDLQSKKVQEEKSFFTDREDFDNGEVFGILQEYGLIELTIVGTEVFPTETEEGLTVIEERPVQEPRLLGRADLNFELIEHAKISEGIDLRKIGFNPDIQILMEYKDKKLKNFKLLLQELLIDKIKTLKGISSILPELSSRLKFFEDQQAALVQGKEIDIKELIQNEKDVNKFLLQAFLRQRAFFQLKGVENLRDFQGSLLDLFK